MLSLAEQRLETAEGKGTGEPQKNRDLVSAPRARQWLAYQCEKTQARCKSLFGVDLPGERRPCCEGRGGREVEASLERWKQRVSAWVKDLCAVSDRHDAFFPGSDVGMKWGLRGGRYMLTKAQIWMESQILFAPPCYPGGLLGWLRCEPVTRLGCASEKGHRISIVQKLWEH